jgi:hypothetical protein
VDTLEDCCDHRKVHIFKGLEEEQELWKSLINTARSYLLIAPCFLGGGGGGGVLRFLACSEFHDCKTIRTILVQSLNYHKPI